VGWSFWSQYGNYASVLGLVTSLLGFGFTIWQVIKSRKAAEEAKMIAREAIRRISYQLFFTQVASASRLGQELQGFIRSKEWHRAIDRTEQLNMLLANLTENTQLSEGERGELSVAIRDLSSVLSRLEAIREGTKQPVVPPKMMELLHRIILSLSHLEGRLENISLED
jgi:signal transduction histidine kinase